MQSSDWIGLWALCLVIWLFYGIYLLHWYVDIVEEKDNEDR